MKLISCHIDAFGKFKNVDFRFDDLSVICENNGFGKTTLAQFVKAMFYSLPASSKRANFKSERDLYRPFDYDGRFGGRLVFECKKGTFIVIRTFGATPTLDRFALYDAETNLPSTEFSSNLGEELFGVGRDTFENSTFFGQNQLVSGINDDIRASLATGVLSGDDIDNFQKAQDKLQKKIKELKSENKTLNIEALNDESERLNAKEEVLKIKIKAVDDDLKEYQKLKKNNEKVVDNVDEKQINEYISKKIAIESVLENDNTKIQEKVGKKKQVESQCKISHEEYVFVKNSNFLEQTRKSQWTYRVFLVLAILGLAGLVVAGICKNMIVLTVFATIVVLSLIIMIVMLFVGRQHADDMKRFNEILKKHNLTQKAFEKELENYKNFEGELKFVDEEIKELEVDIKKSEQALAVLEKHFEMKYGCKIDEFYVKKDANNNKLLEIDKILVELATDKKHYVLDLENLQERKFEISEELTEKQEKSAKIIEKIEILTKTCEFLNKSKDSLSKRFIEPVTNRFNKYYKKLLKNGDDIVIDSNLGIKFGDHFSGVEHLSAGLFDLVYVCKRFALVDLLYKKEKPTLILDDPFSNFDDEKIKIAKQIVKELSQDYQIVMFTCQKARA